MPAFQWAQGGNEIFINVKFSHKIDAPATLNVEPTKVNLTSHELELQASDGRKNFNLHLRFFEEIDPDSSSWSLGSVGRMVFTIRKKQEEPSRWKRLLQTDKRLSQMHYWYEMAEEYEDELEKVDSALEKKKKADKEAAKKAKAEAAVKAAEETARAQEAESVKKDVADLVARHSGIEEKDKETLIDGNEPKLQKPSIGSMFGL